ncbi:hypothetical protein GXW71_31125 [Roseomonas hellenica]|uniref:Uncharacterized protein n=1 Tax=Plastoroseomonas hellenica TaxID=2687306 RepID=A0ABS5F8T9_9PROT|nr:hypothetical protein [Plastoroseomonas hellenica]MBR0668843.1 hypothetical protein [Plastoroseomonas hellenica]
MTTEDTSAMEAAIDRWNGIAAPNQAARAGLADHLALITAFEALRGMLGFEDEPASFEAALRAEQEKA